MAALFAARPFSGAHRLAFIDSERQERKLADAGQGDRSAALWQNSRVTNRMW
jgi:hypothetical protein